MNKYDLIIHLYNKKKIKIKRSLHNHTPFDTAKNSKGRFLSSIPPPLLIATDRITSNVAGGRGCTALCVPVQKVRREEKEEK